MKIRAVLSLLFVAATLGACTGSVTTPEARPDARVSLDSVRPPNDTPSDSTARNGGGLLGSGN